MEMTTTFLAKLVGTVYACNWRYLNSFFLIVQLFQVETKVFVKFILTVQRQLNDVVVVSQRFYFHLGRLCLKTNSGVLRLLLTGLLFDQRFHLASE